MLGKQAWLLENDGQVDFLNAAHDDGVDVVGGGDFGPRPGNGFGTGPPIQRSAARRMSG
jgi:hypothetical protein